MVKIFGLLGFFFLALVLATLNYYSGPKFSSNCQHRVLTSNSFYSGLGESFKKRYFEKFNCELKFAVVNGANLIANLFVKQPKQYDILIGLDQYQIQKLTDSLLIQQKSNYFLKTTDLGSSHLLSSKKFLLWAYDEAPLTFFMRNVKQSQFNTLNEFFGFLEAKNLTVAIPLKTTSILGALFQDWVQSSALSIEQVNSLRAIKFVKSWSEGFGLFERKIVDGFLSFETSEIYFIKSKKISKIAINSGHPNLKEYFTFSAQSKMSDQQKTNFLSFMYSDEIQKLILEKNYMWPTYLRDHEYSKLRTLKLLNTKTIDN